MLVLTLHGRTEPDPAAQHPRPAGDSPPDRRLRRRHDPGVDAGSVSLIGHGRVETRQPTNEVVGKLDAVQGELHEGPCVTAIEEPPESGVVVAGDFEGELDNRRWPRFAPRALDVGYRALLSTPMTPDGVGLRAALDLYSVEANTFDEYTRTMTSLFGARATILLHGSDEATHLRRALDDRDLTGAEGILMERFEVDDEAAFQTLVKSSQETSTKLVAVAERLVTSVMPADPGGVVHLTWTPVPSYATLHGPFGPVPAVPACRAPSRRRTKLGLLVTDSETIDRARLPIVVFHAEGALTTLLGLSIEQATEGLELWSQFRGLSLVEAAEEVMRGRRAGDETPPTVDDDALASLRHHLDSSSSPLDHVNRPLRAT